MSVPVPKGLVSTAFSTLGTALLTMAISFGSIGPVAQAAVGDLDPGFGAGGIVLTPISGGNAYISDVLVLPDGRILAGGSGGSGREFTIARYLPSGQLDPSFGSSGIVSTAIGVAGGGINGLALQGDKIVAVGTTFSGINPVVTLARYNADGLPDPTFSGGGFFQQTAPNIGHDASSVAIQPDRKIVIGGADQGFMIARYMPDGGLDPSFDGDGVAGVPGNVAQCGSGSSTGVSHIALIGDFIVAGGGCDGVGAGSLNHLGLLRYRATPTANGGSFDTTFGAGGAATLLLEPGLNTFAGGLGVQSDGKFLESAQNGYANVDGRVALVRWNPDGTLDSSFGTNGVTAQINFNGQASSESALDIGPGGFVYAGGFRGTEGGFGIASFTSSGALDTSFGGGGTSLQAVGDGVPAPMSIPSVVNDVFAESDGHVLEAGFAKSSGSRIFALVRWQGHPPAGPAGPSVALGSVEVLSLRYRSGKIKARLRCQKSNAASCSGDLELLARATSHRSSTARRKKRRKRSTVRIVSGKFDIPVGKTQTLSMRASRRGRALLRRKRKLAVTVRLTNATAKESATTRSKVVVEKKKRKKHRRRHR